MFCSVQGSNAAQRTGGFRDLALTALTLDEFQGSGIDSIDTGRRSAYPGLPLDLLPCAFGSSFAEAPARHLGFAAMHRSA